MARELNKFGLQTNSYYIYTDTRPNNRCICLLINGGKVVIECNTERDAEEVKNTILYYPTNVDAGHEFNFDFRIKLEPPE